MAAAAESAGSTSLPSGPAGGGGGSGGVVVVGADYCSRNPVELVMKRKVFSMSERFSVTDVHNNLLFRVESVPFSWSGRLIVHNAAGIPILTLKPKSWSFSSRWQVLRGESGNLICSVKRPAFQWGNKLNVYLASNTIEAHCDFLIKGSFFSESCKIYAGESKSAIIAQMHKKHTAKSFFLGKDEFMMTIHPNVDHAFIVALIVVLDAINSSDSAGAGAGASG